MTLAAIKIVLIRKFMKDRADIPPVDGHAASGFFPGSFLSLTLHNCFMHMYRNKNTYIIVVIIVVVVIVYDTGRY